MPKDYILGLDVGVNSVGAAVVECAIENKKDEGKEYIPQRLVALYSRIFQEMVEAKTGTPKNAKRRTMRGARRRLSRLRGRRDALIEFFQKRDLLPKEINEDAMNEIARDFAKRVAKDAVASKWDIEDRYRASPLFMRAYGLDGKLEPYEFACALLQIQKRRGYKSNRGAKYDELHAYIEGEEGPRPADFLQQEEEAEQAEEQKGSAEDSRNDEDKEKEEEVRAVKGGIKSLQQAMDKAGSRSLAEFICQQAVQQEGPLQRITRYSYESESKKEDQNDKFSFYAERKMYLEEFDILWDKQAKALKLNDKDKAKIKDIIFYQRPIINPPHPQDRWKHLRYNDVGKCSFFPKKQRAAKGLLICQDYRTWQVINNLKVGKSEDGDARLLTKEEKEKVYALANEREKVNANYTLAFTKVAQELGVKGKLNYSQARSAEGDSQLIGNRTAFHLKEVLGDDRWNDLQRQGQERLVDDLLNIASKVSLYKRLVSHWKFSSGWKGDALKLAMLELEPGYMKHCVKVVREILECMKEKGKNYYEACEALRYQDASTPYMGKPRLEEQDIPSLANPRVQKALFQIRQVVNAIIDKHGTPAAIHLELARDLKASKVHRGQIASFQKFRRKENIEAEREIMKMMQSEKKFGEAERHRDYGFGYIPRELRSKYKMWGQQKHQCLYCFKQISQNDILDGGAEIDHILPQTSFYQNFMNTVLVCKTCNQKKGKQIPYDIWGKTKEWDRIVNNLAYEKKGKREVCKKYPDVPVVKIKRILLKEFNPAEDADFVQNQLNDTRYIARSIKQVLSVLGVKIRITKGGGAAILRELWGFDSILPRHPDDDIDYVILNRLTGEEIKRGKFTPEQSSEHTSALKPDEMIMAVHDDENKAAGVKNRQDHRHHALDAFVAALTSPGLLIHLTRLNRIDRLRKIEEDKQREQEKQKKKKEQEEVKLGEKEKEYKAYKRKIRQPEGWQGSKVIQQDVQKAADELVVAHERKDKVYGALHEETCYGKSCYYTKEALSTEKAVTNKLQEYLETDPNANGKVIWIARAKERDAIRQWLVKLERLTPKERKEFPLPKVEDQALQKIVLAHRCYVVRKPVTKETLKYAQKAWTPGTKTWIMDEEVHRQLSEWLKSKQNEMDDLEKDPPRMKAKNGLGPPIKSVRVASKRSADSIIEMRGGKIFDLGSNHHAELFSNGKKGDERKIEGRLVSMQEAALRKSQKRSVINKEPSPEWPGQWHFWMSIRINDMVLWNEKSDRIKDHKLLGEPIYRVQKMSGKQVVFRHHSVAATSDTDDHGIIRCHWSTIDGEKVQLNALGDIVPQE